MKAVGVVAEFRKAFELSLVCVSERGVHFLGLWWLVCVCHRPSFLC